MDIINVEDFNNDPRFWEICNEMHKMMKVQNHEMGRHCRMGHGRLRRAEIEGNKHWEYPWAIINGDFQPGMKVLDAGAGRGVMQYYLGRIGCKMSSCDLDGFRSKKFLKFQRALNSIGMAPKPDLTARLRKNAQFFGTEVDVHIEPIQNLSWEDATFDRVYSISVLEHIQPESEAKRAVEELVRVLKPGGKLILTFDFAPNPDYQQGEVFYPEHIPQVTEWSKCKQLNSPDLSCLDNWDAYMDKICAFYEWRSRPGYTAIGLALEKPK